VGLRGPRHRPGTGQAAVTRGKVRRSPAAGAAIVATFSFDGLPELEGDEPGQLAALGTFDASSLALTGRLFAHDHLADRYAWIASLTVDRVTFTTAAAVVPVPPAALFGAGGLAGLPILRRRTRRGRTA